jgi:hypothetical protein
MALTGSTGVRRVKGIGPQERVRIKAFCQGAVYCWIQLRRDEPFGVRELVGGENRNWSGTPLQVLYDRQIGLGRKHQKAMELAGQAFGWLLKEALEDDKRTFKEVRQDRRKAYRWVPQNSVEE